MVPLEKQDKPKKGHFEKGLVKGKINLEDLLSDFKTYYKATVIIALV